MQRASSSEVASGAPRSVPVDIEHRRHRKGRSSVRTASGRDDSVLRSSEDVQDERDRRWRIGGYELSHVLGEGTYATVRYAERIATGEPVAVKVVNREKIARAGMQENLAREIAILKTLKHPHIVDLKSVMATEARIYLVLEYCSSGELFHRISRSHGLPCDDARRVLWQLIDAVGFCHSQGVYHRDLKPENVLLGRNLEVKLTDFGLSSLPDSQRRTPLLTTLCGTPNYAAPEVLARQPYHGAPADVWSLGVVLFTAVVGRLPFDEPNSAVLFRKIAAADYVCPSWVPSTIQRLLRRMLEPDPELRATIEELRRDPWLSDAHRDRRNNAGGGMTSPRAGGSPPASGHESGRQAGAGPGALEILTGALMASLFGSGGDRQGGSIASGPLSVASESSGLNLLALADGVAQLRVATPTLLPFDINLSAAAPQQAPGADGVAVDEPPAGSEAHEAGSDGASSDAAGVTVRDGFGADAERPPRLPSPPQHLAMDWSSHLGEVWGKAPPKEGQSPRPPTGGGAPIVLPLAKPPLRQPPSVQALSGVVGGLTIALPAVTRQAGDGRSAPPAMLGLPERLASLLPPDVLAELVSQTVLFLPPDTADDGTSEAPTPAGGSSRHGTNSRGHSLVARARAPPHNSRAERPLRNTAGGSSLRSRHPLGSYAGTPISGAEDSHPNYRAKEWWQYLEHSSLERNGTPLSGRGTSGAGLQHSWERLERSDLGPDRGGSRGASAVERSSSGNTSGVVRDLPRGRVARSHVEGKTLSGKTSDAGGVAARKPRPRVAVSDAQLADRARRGTDARSGTPGLLSPVGADAHSGAFGTLGYYMTLGQREREERRMRGEELTPEGSMTPVRGGGWAGDSSFDLEPDSGTPPGRRQGWAYNYEGTNTWD
ncbi:unnamed protein product [Pedinophyceae sp. YPF-701]|nr:unnamed protein product [Pedinophyceae sp. YPF-701]